MTALTRHFDHDQRRSLSWALVSSSWGHHLNPMSSNMNEQQDLPDL
ncbi:unnamed protein product [Amoebophrya sp. A25]|nr:unnamed protein product [Amoebophrya sp. A25]|eukprot:GSA25T00004749001.1